MCPGVAARAREKVDETNPDLPHPCSDGCFRPSTLPFSFSFWVWCYPLLCSLLPSLILYGVNEKAVVGRSEVRVWRGEGSSGMSGWRSFKSMGSMYRQRRVFGTESTRQLHQWDGYDTNYEARSGWTGPRGGRLARRLFQMGDKDEKRRGEDGTGDGSRERIAGGRGGRGREGKC